MAYSNNPYAPKTRRAAVDLVIRQGMSAAEAARRSGVHRTTPYRWMEKAKTLDLAWNAHIPTLSSAPRHHPHTLPDEIVAAIVAERQRSGRGRRITSASSAKLSAVTCKKSLYSSPSSYDRPFIKAQYESSSTTFSSNQTWRSRVIGITRQLIFSVKFLKLSILYPISASCALRIYIRCAI